MLLNFLKPSNTSVPTEIFYIYIPEHSSECHCVCLFNLINKLCTNKFPVKSWTIIIILLFFVSTVYMKRQRTYFSVTAAIYKYLLYFLFTTFFILCFDLKMWCSHDKVTPQNLKEPVIKVLLERELM